MPTDSSEPHGTNGGGADFAPNLSKLESEYQILTELHRSADSRTYLARHLEFNRDVTITVVRAPAGNVEGESALRHFASDARSLTTMRHANVIPVIEGRWLDDGAFAIVRARVRGSTLEQVLDAAGPLSPARAAWALEQVNGALAWARANGISHRYVSASALIFQQGSGRVLLSLDPPPVATNALPNVCDDARTIGRLATEMLGGVGAATGRGSLADVRSDLPPAVIGGIEMLTHCDTNASPPDVSAVLRSLESVGDGAPVPAEARTAPAQAVDVEPGAPSVALPLAAAAAVPVAGPSDEAVVVVNHGMSFGARVATAAIVIAALIVVGVVLLHRRAGPNQSASTVADTSTQSGGDIALRSARPDTAVIDPTMVTPTIVSPPAPIMTPAPGSVPPAATYPPATTTTAPSSAANAQVDSMRAVMDSIAKAARPAVAAPGRLHEPERPLVPPVRMPPPGSGSADTTSNTSTTTPPVPSTTSGSTDLCASPAQSDQESCATAAKSRGDADVSAALDRVIAALRRQVNAAPGDPDPASVTRLRQAQESWRSDREAFCRDAGLAPLFGRERGRCYSDRAAQRSRELQQMLDSLPTR